MPRLPDIPLAQATSTAPRMRHFTGKLLRLEAAFLEACSAADDDWLERHLADEFSFSPALGEPLGRARFLQRCRDRPDPPFAARIGEVAFDGDSALVFSQLAHDGSEALCARSRWIGRDGRWQLVAVERRTAAV